MSALSLIVRPKWKRLLLAPRMYRAYRVMGVPRLPAFRLTWLCVNYGKR